MKNNHTTIPWKQPNGLIGTMTYPTAWKEYVENHILKNADWHSVNIHLGMLGCQGSSCEKEHAPYEVELFFGKIRKKDR